MREKKWWDCLGECETRKDAMVELQVDKIWYGMAMRGCEIVVVGVKVLEKVCGMGMRGWSNGWLGQGFERVCVLYLEFF